MEDIFFQKIICIFKKKSRQHNCGHKILNTLGYDYIDPKLFFHNKMLECYFQ